MSRSSDPAKAAEWRQRLRRFSSSGLSVTDFCAKERVSTPSFYVLRKRVLLHRNRHLLLIRAITLRVCQQ